MTSNDLGNSVNKSQFAATIFIPTQPLSANPGRKSITRDRHREHFPENVQSAAFHRNEHSDGPKDAIYFYQSGICRFKLAS